MKRAFRIMAAAVLALGGSVAVGTTASATVSPECTDAGGSYFPDEVCQLVVEVEAVCENDVPYLAYSATLEGGTATVLDMTWVNPDGADVVLEDQPLTGRVRWPGATVDGDGNPTDWPGWAQQADGSWAVGDAYDWSVPEVDVRFAVNPEATVTAGYPQATAQCVPAPTGGASGTGVSQVSNTVSGGTSSAVLSDTGFSAAPVLGAAGGLLLGGTVLLLVNRGRRHAED